MFAYSRPERVLLITVSSLALLLSSIGIVARFQSTLPWSQGAVAAAAGAQESAHAEKTDHAPHTSEEFQSVQLGDLETSRQPAQANLIDLNRATLAELMTLPGIGPTLATRIIEYREIHGGFRRVHDLLHVKGIGQSRLDKLVPLVTVGSAPDAS